MKNLSLRAIAALLCSAPFCNSAQAQTVTHLAPEAWRIDAGDRVALGPASADGAVAWKKRSFEWLYVRGAGTQLNLDALPGKTDPEAPDMVVAPSASDTWLVGVDFDARLEEVGAKKWRAFAQDRLAEGETFAAGGRGPVSVRQHESCKALIVVRDAEGRSGISGTSMSKTGQRMEIRPLADPCTTTPGSALPMRLYLPEGFSKKQRLVARQTASGEEVRTTFDADGYGHVELPSAGPWVFEVHAARAAQEGSQADWELYSTTLAFEAPPAPPKEKAPVEKDEQGEDR